MFVVKGVDATAWIEVVTAAVRAAGGDVDSVLAVQGPASMLEAIANAPSPLKMLPRRASGRVVVADVPVYVVKLRDHPRKGGRCKWYTVAGQQVQGTLEQRYALWLERRGIAWKAHPQQHFPWVDANGRAHWYCPDFYLPATDDYVELKGFWTDAARDKMARVYAQSPDARLSILTTVDVAALETESTEDA